MVTPSILYAAPTDELHQAIAAWSHAHGFKLQSIERGETPPPPGKVDVLIVDRPFWGWGPWETYAEQIRQLTWSDRPKAVPTVVLVDQLGWAHIERELADHVVLLPDVTPEALLEALSWRLVHPFPVSLPADHDAPDSLSAHLRRAHDTLVRWASEDVSSPGVPTGFLDLDAMLYGLKPGQLIVLAGRPAMGCTQLALQIAAQAAEHSAQSVYVASLDRAAEVLAMRLLAMRSRVSTSRMLSGFLQEADWRRIYAAEEALAHLPLVIHETRLTGPADIESKVRQLDPPVGLIVIDDFERLAPHGTDSGVSRQKTLMLAELARATNAAVLVTSGVSRRVQSRKDKRPRLSDFTADGPDPMWADVVLLLYRDSYYNELANPEEAELIVARSNCGPSGSVRLRFERELARFGAWA